MSTDSTLFDMLLTGSVYLIIVIVILVALYIARLRRQRRRGPALAPPAGQGFATILASARARPPPSQRSPVRTGPGEQRRESVVIS